jgi:protein-S-isoprenylcysteine O-methyltransferase Ste14
MVKRTSASESLTSIDDPELPFQEWDGAGWVTKARDRRDAAPIAPPRTLVVTGLYRYVRNPIYVAVVAIILGQAVLFGDWRLIVYGALLWVAFHVIRRGVRRAHA